MNFQGEKETSQLAETTFYLECQTVKRTMMIDEENSRDFFFKTLIGGVLTSSKARGKLIPVSIVALHFKSSSSSTLTAAALTLTLTTLTKVGMSGEESECVRERERERGKEIVLAQQREKSVS